MSLVLAYVCVCTNKCIARLGRDDEPGANRRLHASTTKTAPYDEVNTWTPTVGIWQQQQQSFDDLTMCGDPARLASRLNWISTPPLSSLQPYTPARPGRVQLDTSPAGRLPSAEFTEDFGHYVEGPRDEYGGAAKPDWAAKITGHCSRDDFGWQAILSGCHLDDQPITPCHGPLVVVTDDEVVQRRCGGPHLRRTWWTEESIGTAFGLWLQAGADGELLLLIVLSRTGGSKC